MMTSKYPHRDADVEEQSSQNDKPLALGGELPSESLNDSMESQNNQTEEIKEEETALHIDLPEPDTENITVLTHKLPNKPILPWNRYDSPWEESETEDKEEITSEQTEENLSAPVGDNPPSEWANNDEEPELDEVE